MNAPELLQRAPQRESRGTSSVDGSLSLRRWLEGAAERLPGLALRIAVRRGDCVYRAGDEDGALYLVLEGRVAVDFAEGPGPGFARGQHGPGAVFGESALAGAGARHDRALALEDCVLLRIPGSALLERLHEPALLAATLELLGSRIAETQQAHAALLSAQH